MTKAAHLIRTRAVASTLLPVGAFAQQGYPPPPPSSPPPQYATPPRYGTPWKPGFELVGDVGYHVASDLNYYSGHASIDGSISYGATLRGKIRPGEAVELMWVYAPTTAHFFSTSFGTGDASLNIHYFQIGGSKSFRSDRLEPYFSTTLGAALLSLGNLRISGAPQLVGSDVWRFAFTLGGGLKIWLVEQLALQLEARMLAPVWFSSSAIYVGPGGTALGVSGGIPIVEGNFTGGLVIAL